MDGLGIFDLYNKSDNKTVANFSSKVDSVLHVKTDYNKVDYDDEWLTIMEDTVHYIDNILRSPNRFIVNEEDVVKIEKVRRVTVESIKHLSRNTNFIQKIDPKTGEVQPSKLLNINKEESFNTYENRFIYSLVQNMKTYIQRKKASISGISEFKDNKTIDYNGSCKIGDEQIKINLSLDSKNEAKSESKKDDDKGNIAARIEKLEQDISILTGAQVYQDINKLHIALVTSPIKKTNLILKNVNFQYALKLWDYMQANMDDSVKRVSDNSSYNDTGDLKRYMDESFLIDYLVVDTLSKDEKKEIKKEEIQEKVVSSMVGKIMDLTGGSLSEEELKDIVGKQYSIIKYKTIVSDREIYKVFKTHMDDFLEKTINMKL